MLNEVVGVIHMGIAAPGDGLGVEREPGGCGVLGVRWIESVYGNGEAEDKEYSTNGSAPPVPPPTDNSA